MRRRWLRWWWLPVSLWCVAAAGRMGLLDWQALRQAAQRLTQFGAELFPPRLSAMPVLFRAMLETLDIALLGTALGFVLAVPLAACAARTVSPAAVSAFARLLIGTLRTVPSIVWGVVFVIAVGLGPSAGALGVACYTGGFLGKLFYEAFEAVDPEVLEAVRGSGARGLQIFAHAVLPEAANNLLSQLLFMLEYNIRASAIMGFVGAGGIGYYMLGYVQMLQYQHLLAALLLTFVVVMIVDALSARLRAHLTPAVRSP